VAQQVGTVEEYLDGFPDDIQQILRRIRQIFAERVPDAGDKISYQMPTVTMDGQSLVYYAAWKQHIGMYPIPIADEALESRILPCRGSKDGVKFSYRKPMPYDLIGQIADLLVRRRLDDELDPLNVRSP
jgi:uncharacterized protein YdhG (YjbR/CyaY superfamily)